jgi:hypothetical protein
MRTPIDAYNEIIKQDLFTDKGIGVHKISDKTNHRWKNGFITGYENGQRNVLIDALKTWDESDNLLMVTIIRRLLKELE